jgi:hypothetical protein
MGVRHAKGLLGIGSAVNSAISGAENSRPPRMWRGWSIHPPTRRALVNAGSPAICGITLRRDQPRFFVAPATPR